jgi:hypothetical protein
MQAFANRDYSLCIKTCPEVLQANGSLLVIIWQIFFISCQRIGMVENAESFGNAYIAQREAVAPSFPELETWIAFDCDLVRLTLGRAQLPDILPRAVGDRQRCQAHYYAGARHLTLGDHDRARVEFDLSLATRADCAERRLAEAERRYVLAMPSG